CGPSSLSDTRRAGTENGPLAAFSPSGGYGCAGRASRTPTVRRVSSDTRQSIGLRRGCPDIRRANWVESFAANRLWPAGTVRGPAAAAMRELAFALALTRRVKDAILDAKPLTVRA